MSTQKKPFTLSKLSLNRNTTQINLCMLLLILLAILGIVLTNHSFNSVAESQREPVGGQRGKGRRRQLPTTTRRTRMPTRLAQT